MLKVLIVDDDIISRTHLKTLLDWEHYGFYITGEAENGLEAVKMMERETPDIVITDMSMPFMDGIQLIDHIEQHFPQVRIIALSAYDDFEYVRQSMKKRSHRLRPQTSVKRRPDAGDPEAGRTIGA